MLISKNLNKIRINAITVLLNVLNIIHLLLFLGVQACLVIAFDFYSEISEQSYALSLRSILLVRILATGRNALRF